LGEAERKVEGYLANEYRKIGGTAYKFVSPNRRFVPDRLLIGLGGTHAFIETKAPGGEIHPGQVREIERLQGMGHIAGVIENRDQVDILIKFLKEMQNATYTQYDHILDAFSNFGGGVDK